MGDKWLNTEVSVVNADTQVCDYFVSENEPNGQLIKMHLGNDAQREINEKGLCLTSYNDQTVWTLTQSENFTLESAWQLVRQRNINNVVARKTWSKYVNPKIVLFVWKFLHEALPTDYAIRRKHVMLISK